MPDRTSSGALERPSSGRRRGPAGGLLVLSLLCSVPFASGCRSTGVVTAADASDLRRGDERRRAGDWNGAVAAYDAFLGRPECAPPLETVRAYLGRSDAHLRRGALAAGRIDAEIALASLDPESGAGAISAPQRREFEREAITLLGDADLLGGNPSAARAHYRRALDLASSSRDRDLLTYRQVLCARREGTANDEHLLTRLADRQRPEFRDLDARFGIVAKAAERPPTAVTPPPVARAQVVDARPRTTWRAAPPKANKDPMTRIERITVHHSGLTVTATDEAASAAAIRSIQRDHQDSRGWADIGYHYLIDRAGRVWEGRELRYQGAHAGNAELNRGNVGICLLGDYRTQDVTKEQRAALFEALDALRGTFGVARARVEGHREVKGGTVCPGRKLEVVVEAYRGMKDATAMR